MESKTTRNTVILKNLNSPFIEQAIFILKNGTDESFGDDIVDEAQKIIDTFIKRRRSSNKRKERIRAALLGIPVMAVAVFFILFITKIIL